MKKCFLISELKKQKNTFSFHNQNTLAIPLAIHKVHAILIVEPLANSKNEPIEEHPQISGQHEHIALLPIFLWIHLMG